MGPHLTEIILLVAPRDQRGTTDDRTTAGTERSAVVDPTFAHVATTDDATIVVVATVAQGTRRSSHGIVRPIWMRLGTVAVLYGIASGVSVSVGWWRVPGNEKSIMDDEP